MRRPLRTTAAILALAAAGVAVPSAAQAAFTASASGSMPVSTLALASTEGTFRVGCSRNPTGPYHLLVLTADSLGAVKGATGYEVVLTGPSGETLTEAFAGVGDAVAYVKKKGEWTYAIRAIRTVTATNVWTGPLSAPKTVTCD
ncbi:MAG TPA: hypothetical protein VF885_10345 [Arthrobacter sp.]